MGAISFQAFEERAHASGFDEVVERDWPALYETGSHMHPFEVQALVVRGEFWLTVGDQTRHLRAGDTFELQRDIPHAERYGPDGATYWVARRN
jgi:hypothetical protein